MALRLVRQTSQTPNITNKDDTIMTRYAYGGYNGVVKAFGNECKYTSNSSIFKLLDGRIVIDGWEIDVDAGGWEINLSQVSLTQYYSIYAEINVGIESVSIESKYLSSGGYPKVEKGDDLTSTPNGTARLLLYNVKAENRKITEVIQRFEIIPYLSQKVADIENSINAIKTGTSIPLKATIAEYASADTTKGTIEERLTRLGFKEGSVTLSSGTATTNKVSRQGNYVIGNVSASGTISLGTIFTLGEDYKPKNAISFDVGVISTGQGLTFFNAVTATINTDGKVELSGEISGYYIASYNINFGFEAPPIIK